MTRTAGREIKLGYLLAPQYSWASPQGAAHHPYGADPYIEVAQKLEAALFDVLFRADGFGFVPENATSYRYTALDPTVQLSAIGARTRHIGLAPTISTSFTQPYITARQVLSLDHVSGGRAGWNAVTSFQGERAFGPDPLPDQAIRYERATEFLQIVNGLWSSWGDDSLVLDRASKRFGDASKVRSFPFRGRFYDVEGTSPLPASAQGRPVQFQAGGSSEGRDFAARFAEAVFTASSDVEHAREFYGDLKSRVLRQGRDPDKVLVIPGVWLVLGKTQGEAEDILRGVADGLDFERGRTGAGTYLGADLSALPLDEPVPESVLPADTSVLQRRRSRAELLKRVAVKPGNTLRDVLRTFLLNDGGHYLGVHSYDGAADMFETWFRSGAADGFVLSFPAQGDQIDRFVEHVVPRLQDRRLYRRAYEGDTLRENLGLA